MATAMEEYMEEYMMACVNSHGPPCSACRRPWAGVRRRCCELQVSGLHRRIRGFLHKLSFVCYLHAIICDILFFKYVEPREWRITKFTEDCKNPY